MSALDDARAAWAAQLRMDPSVVDGPLPAWRAVFTDSESLTGVALVCTAEGIDDEHSVLDLGSGPERDEQGVYGCCPWPQFEAGSEVFAAYLVELLNADQEQSATSSGGQR
ncbi:hypothetical protein ACFQ61_10245 [Streptomyces sp. NPDC056500]|uniref:hypothetical protein n=1 Tax=Streptomyces sp. NPDC056500 TaxID=3345840 RepID=UPI00368DCE6E